MSLSGGGGGMGMQFGQFGQNMPFGQNVHHFSTGEFNPAELFNFFSNNVFGGGGGGQSGVNISVNGNGGINIGETIRANFGRMNMNDMRQRLNKPVPIIKNEEISLSKSYTGCTLPIEIVRGIVENGVTREEKETLYLNIPPGIDNNELLILRDKGHIHAENNKGDVKVFIKIINNSEFVRNGLDLILNKTIFLKNVKNEKYGRILADVYVDKIHVNQYMIDKGLAIEYDGGTKTTKSWFEIYKSKSKNMDDPDDDYKNIM
jgi:DnaJ-class molecular chaperone